MLKRINLLLFVFVSVAVLFTSCDNDDDPTPELGTVAEIASGDPQFSTLVSALERTGLTSVLNTPGAFTVFAPTNNAFNALGVDLATISDEALSEILLYHVIGGAEIKAGDLIEGQTYASTAAATGPNGSQLSMLIERAGSSVTINGKINVTSADVDASNGVIHIVDAVILPMNLVDHAAANSNFTELVGALGAATGDLVNVLSADDIFTVFAPVNSAFEEIAAVTATLSADQLAAVLTYHVVGGANVRSEDLSDGQSVMTVNGSSFTVGLGGTVTITDAQGNVATVVLTDVQATNGVIHVIDKVILPIL